MQPSKKTPAKSSPQKGFTLIEIAVAIAILGVGLATLMGTTVRLMDSTYQEINRGKASIYATYILEVALAKEQQASRGMGTQFGNPQGGVSATEMGQQQMGSQSGNLFQHLSQLGYFDNIPSEEGFIRNWTFEFIRQPLDIPLIPIPPQHIILTVRWGLEPYESYTLETIRPPVQTEESGGTPQ